MLEIAVNKRQQKKIERTLAGVPRAMPKVMSRSINKVATAARTKVIRTVADQVKLPKTYLRHAISMRKASYRRWVAEIRIRGKRIPLGSFGARQTKKGVSYRIKKGGGRKKVQSAFIASMDSGHRGVFKRSGTPRMSRGLAAKSNKRMGRKKGMAFLTRPRLPITELFGPSVPAVAEGIKELAKRTLNRELRTKLKKEIGVQVELVLKRSKAG